MKKVKVIEGRRLNKLVEKINDFLKENKLRNAELVSVTYTRASGFYAFIQSDVAVEL